MAYYLGIDAGGTKTRCVLADETVVLAKAMAGGSNIVRLGERQAREALQTAIRQVCSAAEISPSQIRAICIGAAGAARPEMAAKIRSIINELVAGGSTRVEVVGDSEIALEAAFGAGPGVIAIAGTGSIVYGRDANGRTARAGGWGFAVSDEGSGHWIGRSAVSAILSSHDQGRETALTALVLRSCRLETIDELVQWANSTPPPDFPRLFPIVLRAAAEGDIEGDTVARDLLADAGARLAALAVIVERRLMSGTEAGLPIAMTGSVFRQSREVREAFYNVLRESFPEIVVLQDPVDPVEGAIARARRK
ncbi:MAG TPA: BadF/BadG/BcrA/BcrD ATPase family protein [Terriglobales bacterium]|nr:BadF/BadG/BcrA/BcrD ATPase family protein [Terriglobales bacterium]